MQTLNAGADDNGSTDDNKMLDGYDILDEASRLAAGEWKHDDPEFAEEQVRRVVILFFKSNDYHGWHIINMCRHRLPEPDGRAIFVVTAQRGVSNHFGHCLVIEESDGFAIVGEGEE